MLVQVMKSSHILELQQSFQQVSGNMCFPIHNWNLDIPWFETEHFRLSEVVFGATGLTLSIYLHVYHQAPAAYAYADPYFGGMVATYGTHAMVSVRLLIQRMYVVCKAGLLAMLFLIFRCILICWAFIKAECPSLRRLLKRNQSM